MTSLYGVIGIFDKPEDVVRAAKEIQKQGFTRVEAFSPFPIENLSEYLAPTSDPIAAYCLTGGILGCISGFFMQYYAYVIDFPLNVGGRPHNSWPAYIPITFELTILFASFFTLFSMFITNGLPRPYHPIFNSKEFSLASGSQFCLCVKSKDKIFDIKNIKVIFKNCDALKIEEVPL